MVENGFYLLVSSINYQGSIRWGEFFLLGKHMAYCPNLAIWANVSTSILQVVGSSLSSSPALYLTSRPPVTLLLHTIPLQLGFECG
jgi:hypothetical protein